MSIGCYTHNKLVSIIKTVIKTNGLGGHWTKSGNDLTYGDGQVRVAGAAAFSGTDATFVTFVDEDATPSVATGNLFKTNTTGVTITMFDDGVAGQTITVISAGAIVFDVTSTNLKGGSTNITTASGDITTWTFDGTNWYLQQFMDVSANMSSVGGGGASLPGIDDQTSSNDDQLTITDTAVIINEDSDDVDFRVESQNEANAILVDASADVLHINKGKSAFSTKIWSNVDNAFEVNSSGVVVNEEGHATNDFRVESDSNTHMLFVDSGNNRVEVKGTTPILRIDADTDNFAKLEWAENGTRKWAVYHDHSDDNLTFKQGTAGSGTDLMVITQGGRVGMGTIAPYTALSVVQDYATTTFESQITAGQGGGHIIKYGSGTLTAGKLYYLHTDAAWTATDSDAVASGASQLLGIAMGSSPTSNGVLLKGYVRIAAAYVNGTAATGQPVYVDNGTAGEYNFTAPTGTADFVRIVGYCIDIHSSDILLYFDPDNSWVEIS